MQDINRQSTEVVVDKFMENLRQQGIKPKPTWTTIIFLIINFKFGVAIIGKPSGDPSSAVILALALMVWNSLVASQTLDILIKYKHFLKTEAYLCVITFIISHVIFAATFGVCSIGTMILVVFVITMISFILGIIVIKTTAKRQAKASTVLVDALCVNVEVSRTGLINNDMSFQHSNLSPNYMEVIVPTFQYMYNNTVYTQKPMIRNSNSNFIVGQHYNIYVNPSKPDEINIA